VGIERAGLLAGGELVWLADPFLAYVAHVQGSARIRLPDGKIRTVGYDGCNGHPYRSVAVELVKDGRIPAAEISLHAMIRYFQDHPGEVVRYTERNPRFVFFRFTAEDPRGSLNVPVTPYRSIATDKSIFPRGALAFLDTVLPQEVGGAIRKVPYRGFALDQDTGGAIRAAGRCDLYLGVGDLAGRLAGRTREEGRLYYLFLREEGR
jgi:membrane-bound lytic murein transglycosylase A